MPAGSAGSMWDPGFWDTTFWEAGFWGDALGSTLGSSRAVVSELTLLIAGVGRSIEPDTLYASFPANGRGTLSCRIVSADGSYVPSLDQDVYLFKGPTLLFGGVIMQPRFAGVFGEGLVPITSTIDVTGFAAYTDRRYVNGPLGGTLKTILTILLNFLSPYGVTLDPAQVDGPTLTAADYVWVRLTEVLEELSSLSGYIWDITDYKVLRMYAPGTIAAPFNVIDGGGQAVGDITVDNGSRLNSDRPYANFVRVIAGPDNALLTATAQDNLEIGIHTLWELVVFAPTVTTQAAADALAAALLVQQLPTPKTVTYQTYTPGLRPGQTQTITIADRHLDNTFLITEVQLSTDGDLLLWTVTAIEGLVYQGNWRDYYGAGGQNTVTSGGGGTGGGGGGGTSIAVFPLSGSGIEAVQSAAPTWVPASAIKVVLDTVELGKTAATVFVQLRADSGTVTARLRNVSDGVTVGTSSAVSGATFQMVTFAVSLTPGSKTYQLELNPSVANVDVAASGGILK